MPIKLYFGGSQLPNADVLGLFRQTTCSASASVQYNTFKERKIYSSSDCRKIEKTPIVCLLLQFKHPTAKLGLFHENYVYLSIHDP